MKRGACGPRSLLLAAALALGACFSGPPVSDWQSDAKSALERAQPQEIALLPAQHRPIANPALRDEAAVAALKDIEDPLARLVAAGVLMRSGRANPAAVALAVDTASAQGWRRPRPAWLNARLALARKVGDAGEAERLRRRIALILGDR